jgi:hypothetical protein
MRFERCRGATHGGRVRGGGAKCQLIHRRCQRRHSCHMSRRQLCRHTHRPMVNKSIKKKKKKKKKKIKKKKKKTLTHDDADEHATTMWQQSDAMKTICNATKLIAAMKRFLLFGFIRIKRVKAMSGRKWCFFFEFHIFFISIQINFSNHQMQYDMLQYRSFQFFLSFFLFFFFFFLFVTHLFFFFFFVFSHLSFSSSQ